MAERGKAIRGIKNLHLHVNICVHGKTHVFIYLCIGIRIHVSMYMRLYTKIITF
jgi:hypothetical protein